MFIVHLTAKSHNLVLDNLEATVANCPGERRLGLFDTSNAFLFLLEGRGNCSVTSEMARNLFARKEVRAHEWTVVLRSPCDISDSRQADSVGAAIMERFNSYEDKIARFSAQNTPIEEALFSPLPMKVKVGLVCNHTTAINYVI